MGLPLVAASLPEGANAAAVAQVVGASVACVVEAGPDHGSTAPSVIRVEGRRCIVERAGAFSQDDIDQLSLCRALFVCTGNTCRSPMASAMLSKLLADHWGISGNDLNSGGFFVQSAGLAAMMGAPASPDAVTVVADLGGDLSQHRSGMITMEMLLWADYLFGMTAGHCYTLESLWSEGMTPPRLLSPTHEDIADPIGGALVDYRTCAAQILACLQARLPEFLES
jgi:protein-tyrosine phosphatase